MGRSLVIIGGRTTDPKYKLPLEIYDIEMKEWSYYESLTKYRFALWNMETVLFIYGGFDYGNLTRPSDQFLFLDLKKLMERT